MAESEKASGSEHLDRRQNEAFAADETGAAPGPGAGVLDSLAGRMVSVPRVLLRSATGGVPDSVVRTGSDEIPKGPTGRYQLHGEIARGGMGVVVRGRDTDLGRDLAVKILLERHKNRPELLQRFVEEAQIGGQLQHPGIVPVYELGTMPGGRPFFSMKLVKGKTLAALLASRRDPGEERAKLLGIFEQISQTLAYAHARGVIHRDLKPSNVMVGAFGEVQVMDWGLAKVLPEGGIADEKKTAAAHTAVSVIRTDRSAGSASGSGSETLAGSVLGTPAYMAPEQARGEVDLVDERADVFGLGAILCETLTGEPAFTGRPAEAQRKAQLGEVQDAFLRLDRSGAEAELVALAKRCLAAEPWNRPRHAGEVAETVASHFQSTARKLREAEIARAAETARAEEAVLRVAEEQKAREAAQARVLAERRARRTTVALAATILVMLSGVGGGWLWISNQRDARLRRVTGEVHAALERVAALREKASAAPAEDPTTFAEALSEIEHAKVLSEDAPTAPELKRQIATLLGELEEAERDRALVEALGKAWEITTEPDQTTGSFRDEDVIPLFQKALAAWGISAGETPRDNAVRRIRGARQPVQVALLGALGFWRILLLKQNPTLDSSHAGWIEEVLSLADDDPWRRAIREASVEKDRKKRRETLIALAQSVDLSQQPTRLVTNVAFQLRNLDALETSRELLERLWWRDPGNFWVNQNLLDVSRMAKPRRFEDATRFATAIVAIRPRRSSGFSNLGVNLEDQGETGTAITSYRRSLEIDPHYAWAHYNLALSQLRQGRLEEAAEGFRQAIRFRPTDDEAHATLGLTLQDQGKFEEGVGACREAVRLEPTNASYRYNLGNGLHSLGKLEEALAAYDEAIRLQGDYPEAHCNRGHVLQAQGRYREALEAFRQGHGFGSKRKDWSNPSADWVRMAEALVRIEGSLDDVVSGRVKPASAQETVDYAWCAYLKHRYAASVRLYEAALAKSEAQGLESSSNDRYNAACTAALAAFAAGEEATFDAGERSSFRAKALSWLRANLERYQQRLAKDPEKEASKIEESLTHWQGDRDLRSVRDEAALSTLPGDEAEAWRGLWRDVQSLRERARGIRNGGEKQP